MNPAGDPQRILFLCTANICRSPTAEFLARRLAGENRWAFRSAGFLESGRAPSDDLIKVLGDRGIDIARHRSYQVDRASLEAADLVLTMEGAHVRRATEVWPEVWSKILPLRQAVAFIDEGPGALRTVDDLLSCLDDGRDPAEYFGTRWDVDDPYGRGLRFYRRSVDEIDRLVTSFLSLRAT